METWFSNNLKKWYHVNKRDLPWRNVKDPYKIWLSEVILQQTQVVQGLSYYLKFIDHYPTVSHLAKAKEDAVLKDWQGLGYYSRARNLHAAAKEIEQKYKGKFPQKYEDIRALKGVGDYTAAAIASFAYNLPQAVVDGNVYRVLSRIFGIEIAIDSSEGKKQFQQLANELLDKKDAETHNQAIMEFGSQYCKPVNPGCDNCMFKSKCFAFKHNKVSSLPFKAKKTKVTNRYFNYIVLIDKKNNVLVNKRSAKDIWQGLYEFELIETEKEFSAEKLFELPAFKKIAGKNYTISHTSKKYKHMLSHQHLYATFYVVKTNAEHKKPKVFTNVKTLTKFAYPRLVEKFLNDCILA